MKQSIIIAAVTTTVILAIAVMYSKKQVTKGKKGLFA